MIGFPKPRYEVRRAATSYASVWNNDRNCVVTGCEETSLRAATVTAAALNSEYQRWLTDWFYEKAAAAEASRP